MTRFKKFKVLVSNLIQLGIEKFQIWNKAQYQKRLKQRTLNNRDKYAKQLQKRIATNIKQAKEAKYLTPEQRLERQLNKELESLPLTLPEH